uniref:Uncharacterized protein n=1 Tax=Siphoviridae sp. ctYaH2 TaxID=2825549 RepID=A0A8S5V564_9CAUD|nr:MAG TPA: hypothetical protein [Siphoviridae sp. ctYaH2]
MQIQQDLLIRQINSFLRKGRLVNFLQSFCYLCFH